MSSYEIVGIIRDKKLFGEEMKNYFDEHPRNYNYFIRQSYIFLQVFVRY